MKQDVKYVELRWLWLLRADNKRTGNDVLAFNGDMQREHPDLLVGMRGDSYQNLKTVLKGLIPSN
jgi:hypothetical protein